jgi:hypothetical protein
MLYFNNDLKYGLSKEIDIINKIKLQFPEETNIRNTKEIYNKFCLFDFESDLKTSWEMKSRRNTKTQYPTTIIPVHKIRDVETTQYFIFYFTDVISYIKYDKDVFDKFNKKIINANRKDGYNNHGVHYEIPVNMLIDFI